MSRKSNNPTENDVEMQKKVGVSPPPELSEEQNKRIMHKAVRAAARPVVMRPASSPSPSPSPSPSVIDSVLSFFAKRKSLSQDTKPKFSQRDSAQLK